MERVSDEWLDGAIQKYSAIDSKSKGVNMYHLALCELRERRQMEDENGEFVVASTFMAIKTAEILQLLKKAEKEHGHTDNSASEKDGAGATQEREKSINEFWEKIASYYSHRPCNECPATSGDNDCGYWAGTCGHSLRKKYESIAGIPQKNAKEAVLPAPVKQVDGVDVKTWTIKQWLAKINEELDELKDAVWFGNGGLGRIDHISSSDKFAIADEATDTITAITSMLEAMGIDEQQRQAAQVRVNNNNRQRGRF